MRLGVALGLGLGSLDGYGAAPPAQSLEPNRPGLGPAMIYPDLPNEGPVRDDLDAFGGWKKVQGKKTGFFHVEQVGNRWWFITPEGNAYFALSMNGGPADRLRRWGFNCVSAGGSRPKSAESGLPEQVRLPYTASLFFARQAKLELPIPPRPGLPPWVTFPDVFDPSWPEKCREHADTCARPLASDPLLVGYFLDNELCLEGWYEAVTNTEPDAPARKAFVEVAQTYYADKPGQLAQDWKQYQVAAVDDLLRVKGTPPPIAGLKAAWELAVADRFFATTVGACRNADPNHIILGTRMINGLPPSPEILGVMGKYCDVISLNLYSPFPDRLLTQIFTMIAGIHLGTKRPLMTSEFTYRGGDTLNPNTIGAPPTMHNQAERGVGYLSYVSAVASLPFYVGVSWYTYGDDERQVPWDGYREDCNFGVVDREDRPYAVLTEVMRETNASIYELASDPVQNPTCPLFWRTELARWDREWDKQMLQRYGRIEQPVTDPLANLLPEDRRYHGNYWVRHRSPNLIVNDDRFFGCCQANMIRDLPDGQELVLIGVQWFTSLPRSLWLGKQCENPDTPMPVESNAQFLARKLDPTGKLRRLTMADGSYIMTNFNVMELRTDLKVAYLDIVYDPAAQTLAITTRGPIERLGLRDVNGWKPTWNGQAVAPAEYPAPEGTTVLPAPAGVASAAAAR